MAEYRTLKMSFWSDPFIEELSAPQKLLYLYLITSEHTNSLGIAHVSIRKIAFETGLDVQDIEECIIALEGHGKLIRDGHDILLINFIKNQCALGEKVRTGLRSLFAGVSSKTIKEYLIKEYQFLAGDEDTVPDVSNGRGYLMDRASGSDECPMDTLSIPIEEQEQEQERKDSFSSSPPAAGDDLSRSQQAEKKEPDQFDGSYPAGVPRCPHQAIIAVYHEILPELPGVRTWRPNKAVELKSRWVEKFREGKFRDVETGIAYFRRFFEYVRTRDFLMGRTKPWRADLGWLVKAANFDKVTAPGSYRNAGEEEAA